MHFRVLGPMEVRVGRSPVPIGGKRQRAVLASLLLHLDEDLHPDRLTGLVWDDPPRSATKTLQTYVYRLRRALSEGDAGERLASGPGGYRLVLHEDDEIDIVRFQHIVDRGRRALTTGDAEHAADLLREALTLWQGRALVELGDAPLARDVGPQLEEMRAAALEDRVEADLACGRHQEIVSELERFAVDHPLRERLRGQLMLSLHRCGRTAEALEAFRVIRNRLAQELGVDPSEPLRELHEGILRGDPELMSPGHEPSRGTRPRPWSAEPGQPTVMLVDDHPLWRDTLRRIIERLEVGIVVAEASDGDEALALAKSSSPEVVVMDIDLPTIDGVEATRRLMSALPTVRILVLSATDDRRVVLDAVQAGASGYVVKTAGPDEVADAVRRIHAGELVFPPRLAATLLDEFRQRGEGSVAR